MKPYILCVDDEKSILDSLRAQLEHNFSGKFNCEIAQSAEEAWEVLEELMEDGEQIIVIVSDWLMPDTKGDQLLIDIHKKFPNIVKIMLTGQADELAVKRAVEHASLDDYIAKPWSEDDLVKTISSRIS